MADDPRSVLVTGGSRGIGLAIAEAFLAAGDKVAVLSPSGRGPDGALAISGDASSSADVDAAFAQIEAAHGPVQILVANAGITRDGLLMRMTDDDFDSVLAVDLAGPFKCARRAATAMTRARAGRIILVSSVVALHGSPGQTNYAAAKAGLVGLARSITRELGGRGVTANVIAPGFIATDMTAGLPTARREEYLSSIPAKRFGLPDDVASLALFLASAGAGYISGAVIPVDGGLGMGH